MHVEGSLPRCIRFLIHAYLPSSTAVHHIYLRQAAKLRPDWSLPQTLHTSPHVVETKV
jgi:chorismate mutase